VNLTAPVISISGIGTKFAGKLTKLGISTIFDLLYHLPFRYENRLLISPVSQVQPGETVTVIGKIISIKNEFTHSGRFVQKGILEDNTGQINIVWFNQMFLVKSLKGKNVALYGKADFFGKQIALVSPEYEFYTSNTELVHMGRVVPVYPETAGVSSKWLRSKIFSLLKILPETDPWPAPGLPLWKETLINIHFPKILNSQFSILNYKNRLAYDEIFLLQTKSLNLRSVWQKINLSHPFTLDQSQVLNFISNLPFTLTSGQNQAIKEILNSLSLPAPMNRLLEGDVGSGKTVVAAIAAFITHLNGFQSIFLAPTQILATQHYQTLSALFKPYGIKIALVTANTKNSHFSLLNSQLVVGTHALLSDKNKDIFEKVGLVVIDEQHRFGVLQRALAAKLGSSPHILTMTATPIPRSVALTMFGELDLSQLPEKPAGRIPVKTWIVPESKRSTSYPWILNQLQATSLPASRQAFWVCPFIDTSESAISVKAVTAEYDRLSKIFTGLKLGLLHGRLKSADKDKVITSFKAGDYDILVTTPIVEVGIDIPNASIIIIEGAERFGLAQLHQLRGRVGRNSTTSYCLLFTSSGEVPKRLKALETLDSGIQLAELDLKYRGPGEIYGTSQHGFPEFKIAGYDNIELIEKARNEAKKVLPQINSYPLLRDLIENDKITLIQPN